MPNLCVDGAHLSMPSPTYNRPHLDALHHSHSSPTHTACVDRARLLTTLHTVPPLSPPNHPPPTSSLSPHLCVDGAHLSVPSPTYNRPHSHPSQHSHSSPTHTACVDHAHITSPETTPLISHPLTVHRSHSSPTLSPCTHRSHSSPTLSPCTVDTLFHTVTPSPSSTHSMLFSSSPEFTKPIPITPGTVFVLFLPHIMHSSHTTDPSQ
ncbi:hypothetical protein L227DRAFT_605935 [Lentinus tigrinus ALCF2SS1-6]|uniref:Uncharacterized protein n=1 Tax=Lentinus tigrinus ALCF2SS1-6 TaxID=1328759 RepID=A0A5C2SUL2_9APHY|nr:hypothetical protein L227DRAFT_605935 [Lentinus tigrinus ALCF2SS1-6]